MKIDRTTIETTLRTAVAAGATDRVIAQQLGVGTSTICVWRSRYGIPPADKFQRHFVAKHGPEAWEQLMTLVAQGTTLRAIANEMPFTYQYVQQIWPRIRHSLDLDPTPNPQGGHTWTTTR